MERFCDLKLIARAGAALATAVSAVACNFSQGVDNPPLQPATRDQGYQDPRFSLPPVNWESQRFPLVLSPEKRALIEARKAQIRELVGVLLVADPYSPAIEFNEFGIVGEMYPINRLKELPITAHIFLRGSELGNVPLGLLATFNPDGEDDELRELAISGSVANINGQITFFDRNNLPTANNLRLLNLPIADQRHVVPTARYVADELFNIDSRRIGPLVPDGSLVGMQTIFEGGSNTDFTLWQPRGAFRFSAWPVQGSSFKQSPR